MPRESQRNLRVMPSSAIKTRLGLLDQVISKPTIRQSAAVQTGYELLGPIRSAAIFTANRASRGRLFPSASEFFDVPREGDQQLHSFSQIPAIVGEIEHNIGTREQRPEGFIGVETFRKWQSAKTSLQEALQGELGEALQVTDYVTQSDEGTVFFYQHGESGRQMLYALVVNPSDAKGMDLENLSQQVRNPRACAEIIEHDTEGNLNTASNIAIENAVETIQSLIIPNAQDTMTFRVSSVTNKFFPLRHAQFERDGEMFTEFRHRGVASIKELQELQQVLFQKTLTFDTQGEGVKYDQDLANIWLNTFQVAYPDKNQESAQNELKKYAREKLYFEFVAQWLEENPSLVTLFRNSKIYTQYEDAFRDRNLSAVGLTETQMAAAMLANYYLYLFEGVGSIQDSPSQKYLATIDNFHSDIAGFVNEHATIALELPDVTQDKRDEDQTRTLFLMANKLKRVPYQTVHIDEEEKIKVITRSERTLENAKNEIVRHQSTQFLVDKLGLIHGEDSTLYQAVVANFGLARVPGENRFTESSWFINTDTYLPQGTGLFPFEREQHFEKIEDAIRYVFNGDEMDMGDGSYSDSAYESQVARIYQVGGQVLSFLQASQRVPENVKEVMQTIDSTQDFRIKVLETFGDANHQDPLVVNRFSPEGFEQFRLMVTHRYVTDFLRGVETELVKATKPLPEKLGRRFAGKWKNYDFSSVDEQTLNQAVEKTLSIGEHRINKLNHEVGVKKNNLKDWQEFFELALGWDTNEMKFLRWDAFLTIWNTMGPTWSCICFSRKPIFNTGTMQQF